MQGISELIGDPLPQANWDAEIAALLLRFRKVFIHDGLDRIGPDLVALRRRVEKVRHDLLCERAIWLEKFRANVQKGNPVALKRR